jgi:hypothetical protein
VQNGKNSLRLQPIAFHSDLLRFRILAGLDFVWRMAGCSKPGHYRVETTHRCTKLRGFLLVIDIDHDDFAGREFRREDSVPSIPLVWHAQEHILPAGDSWESAKSPSCSKGGFSDKR